MDGWGKLLMEERARKKDYMLTGQMRDTRTQEVLTSQPAPTRREEMG